MFSISHSLTHEMNFVRSNCDERMYECTQTCKGKRDLRFSTYITPQAAHSAPAVLFIADRAGVQPRTQLKPAHTDFGIQPYSQSKCCMPSFQFLCFHLSTCITTRLLTRRDGRLSWSNWLTIAQSGHLLTINRAQVSESPPS